MKSSRDLKWDSCYEGRFECARLDVCVCVTLAQGAKADIDRYQWTGKTLPRIRELFSA